MHLISLNANNRAVIMLNANNTEYRINTKNAFVHKNRK